MLAHARKVMLELNLSQLQCHPDARDAMLAPASYCEPILRHLFYHMHMPHHCVHVPGAVGPLGVCVCVCVFKVLLIAIRLQFGLKLGSVNAIDSSHLMCIR